MSSQTRAPVLLLIGAALSVAAVFGVHRIESRIGPFSEPYATRYFSPLVTTANIRFTTHRPERVTLRIVDERGAVRRTLLTNERIRGSSVVFWDGRDDAGSVVRDGIYSARLTRSGDRRGYEPARPIEVDTRPPAGRVVQLRRRGSRLIGVAMLGERARVEAQRGEIVLPTRTWRVQSGSLDPQLLRAAAAHLIAYRFTTEVSAADDPATVRLIALDRAGNPRPLGIAGSLIRSGQQP